MKRVTICGYFGYMNAGDELILKSIISNLKKRVEALEITVLSCRKQQTREMFGIKAINRWNPVSVIASFIGSDLVIFAGGLFQDVTGFMSIYYYLGLILAAKILGKKVLLYGIEFAPIKRKSSMVILKLLLGHVDSIAVRSNGSFNFVEKLNVRKNYELSADGVMLFNTDSIPRGNKTELKKIGFILKSNENSFSSREEYLGKITLICECIVNRLDVEITFIPFHLERDFEFSLKVVKNLQSSSVVTRWNKVEDLFEIMGDMDFIVSQRLHGLIVGSLLKLPLLGISNDPKLEYFCSELGQKHVSFQEINANTIAGIVEDIWKWQEDFKLLLDKNIPKLKYRSYLNVDHALQLL